MFRFFKNNRKNKDLDAIIQRIQMNVSNNYKDAAQQNLAEFENALKDLEASGTLDSTLQAYYEDILQNLKTQMKNFTHKDQKPYWS